MFAAHAEGGQTCIQVFFFRTGQNWGNRAYYPRADKSLSTEEVLEAFIAQFYDDKPVPRLILTSHALPTASCWRRRSASRPNARSRSRRPSAATSATSSSTPPTMPARRSAGGMAETSSQARHLEGVAKVFGLAKVPRRVEVYDNSHIMGTNAVGAMIVAGPEGFAKAHYRKFNIKIPKWRPATTSR